MMSAAKTAEMPRVILYISRFKHCAEFFSRTDRQIIEKEACRGIHNYTIDCNLFRNIQNSRLFSIVFTAHGTPDISVSFHIHVAKCPEKITLCTLC